MDLRAARECLGVRAGATRAEVEDAHRRVRVELESSLRSAEAESARVSARAALLGADAARDALVATARARPPAPMSPAGAASLPSPAASSPADAARPARRRVLWLSLAAAVVVGGLVFALLPRKAHGDPAAARRQAEAAEARWTKIATRDPKATLGEAAKEADAASVSFSEAGRRADADDRDEAAASYARARDAWSRAAGRAETDSARAEATAADATVQRLAGEPAGAVPAEARAGEESLREADASYGKGALDEARPRYLRARDLLVPVAHALSRSRLADSLRADDAALARSKERFGAAEDGALDLEAGLQPAEAALADASTPGNPPEAARDYAVLRRRRALAGAARAAWEAAPRGPDEWKAAEAEIAGARRASAAGKDDEAAGAAAGAEERLRALDARLVALEAALLAPAAKGQGAARMLDATPFPGALGVPPEVTAALASGGIRLVADGDRSFQVAGAAGWSLTGTWEPVEGDAAALALTTWVIGREVQKEGLGWDGVVVALSPSGDSFAFLGTAGKATPWQAVLARLLPAFAFDAEALAARLAVVLGEKARLDAQVDQATGALSDAAAVVPSAAAGDGLVAAQKAYAAAASVVRALEARREAWEAAVAHAPEREQAQDALAAIRTALAAEKPAEAISRLEHARWLVSRLEERAGALPAGEASGAGDLAGTYTLGMDLWLAPPLVKFAIDGSQVRLDLYPDGSFALVTNLSGRLLSTAGRWQRRGEADDVSLDALVEDRAVFPAGKPWGDAFVRLSRAKKAFGFKTATYNAPIPWLRQVEPELSVAAAGPVVTEPAEGGLVGSAEVRIKGRVQPVVPGAVLQVDGKAVPVRRGEFSVAVRVEPGEGERQVTLSYGGPGIVAAKTVRKFFVDTIGPRITVTEPAQVAADYQDAKAVIRGYIDDPNLDSATINGEPLALVRQPGRALFEATVSLSAVGERIFDVRASDRAGNKAQGVRRRLRYIPPPTLSFTPVAGVPASTALLILDAPLHEATLAGLSVRVEGRLRSVDPADVVYVNGARMSLVGQSFATTLSFVAAGDQWIVVEVLRDGARIPGERIQIRVHMTG